MRNAGSARTVLLVGIPVLVLLCIPLLGIGCPSTNPGVPYTSAISAYEVAEGVSLDMLHANFGPPARDATRPRLDALKELFVATEGVASFDELNAAWKGDDTLSGGRFEKLVEIAYRNTQNEAKWPEDLATEVSEDIFVRGFRGAARRYLELGGVEVP